MSTDDQLLQATYKELRRIASAQLATAARASLVPTELVHEAYLRLSEQDGAKWDNRRHFFAAAAESMRRILVDRSRARGTLKRGEGREKAEIGETAVASEELADELLDVDEALSALESRDPHLALIVKLRYFAGLPVEEVAATLETSERSVYRDWSTARAWLRMRIETQRGDG